MIPRKALLFAALAVCAFFLSPDKLAAQSTATLTGTITDQSGAVIPGAKVLCRNTGTDLELRTVANGSGLFRIPNVPVGTYELTISHPGFGTLVRGGIELLTEHTVDLSLMLQVGASSQSVSVTAAVPLVQSTTSDVQTTVNSRQMAELPLNGRNAFQLAVLTPGATDTEAGTIPGQQENLGLAVNGMRPTETNWSLDGGSYTNAQNGGAPTLPNPDTLQEFTALTSNYSAENRGGGAAVKLTTRSGTNQIHGTLFEFLRNDFFDARNFFDLSTEAYKQSQYGATLGGPIRKNKLFYFGSFQGTNKRGSPNPKTLTVPTAAQHNGDFSATGHTIVDQKSGSAPFPGDIIPQSRWDSIGTKLLGYMPLPNIGANLVALPTNANQDDYQYMIKLDYVMTDKDHLSGRFFSDRNLYQRDNNSLAGLLGNDYYRNQAVLLGETHTFGPSWVMENSFNFLRTYRTEVPVDPIGNMQELGAQVQPAQPNVPTKIYVTLSGYTAISTPRGIWFNPYSLEYRNTVSRALGSHFIRFGGQYRYNSDYMLNLGDETGNWAFNATSTTLSSIKNSGDAIAGLLLGLPQTFTQSVSKAYTFTNTLFALWVQDDWKVSRRLTFNVGLREDPWMAPRLANGLLMGFVPGAHSTVAPLSPAGLLYSGDPGVPNSILHDHYFEFAPRFGLAWDMQGNGKAVLRGGYGIYRNNSEVFSMWRYWASAAPGSGATVTLSAPPSTANPYQGFTGTIPFPYTPITKSQLATYVFPQTSTLYAFDPSTKPGYTQSWNLTFERQLRPDTALTVAYVANHFIRALANMKGNAAVYAPGATTATANLNARRPYQGIGSMESVNDFDHGDFNSLQVGITKRPARGLILQSSYTFSKALDLNSSDMLGGALGQAPRDPNNADLDKGPADFDATHSFKAMVLYDLPGLRSARGVVRALMNGWQLNGIGTARTGFPFTCRSGVNNSLSGISADTCDQVLLNAARPAGANSMMEWFNTAAFTTNKIGTFGTAGRNTLRRPGVFTIDLAALKRVNLTERIIGELRLEAFNALNHPNFSLWNTPGTYTAQETVSSPTFGQITAAQSPRLMQVSMKLRF